jgi:hypothetical protein
MQQQPSSGRISPSPSSAFAFFQPAPTVPKFCRSLDNRHLEQHQLTSLMAPSNTFGPRTYGTGQNSFPALLHSSNTGHGYPISGLESRFSPSGPMPEHAQVRPAISHPAPQAGAANSLFLSSTVAKTGNCHLKEPSRYRSWKSDASAGEKKHACWLCYQQFFREEDLLEHAKVHNIALSEERDLHFMNKVVEMVMKHAKDRDDSSTDFENEDNDSVITSCGLVRKMKPLRDGIMSRHYIQSLFLRLEQAGIGTVNIRRNSTIRSNLRPFGERERACVNAYSVGDARLLRRDVQLPRSVVLIPRQLHEILNDKRSTAFLKLYLKGLDPGSSML